MEITRRALAIGGALLACGNAPAQRLRGINLAGLEFNNERLPGRRDTDFVAPGVESIDYFKTRGANLIRLPFIWERLEPRLGGPFDQDYLASIDGVATLCAQRNMKIVLSPHQFGRRHVNGQALIIGESDAVPAQAFAHFWGQFSARYQSAAHVIFGLQNEPHDQDSAKLAALSNQCIAAIRSAGCRQLILAPGNNWSGAHSWNERGNAEAMLAIRDPADNCAFEAHQYLDSDNSGSHGECSQNAGAERLRSFTTWAKRNGRRGFLGEFGAGPNGQCLHELDDLLAYMDANNDVWIGWAYWAGGPWWGEDYPLGVEARHGQDRPQMQILRRRF